MPPHLTLGAASTPSCATLSRWVQSIFEICQENGVIIIHYIIVTPQGLLAANNERKSEIDALRGDHDTLKKDHDALVNTTERENDLR